MSVADPVPDSMTGRYSQYVNPGLMQLLETLGYGRVYTRASDVWLWDNLGRQYLDCLAGFGAVNIGHNHPQLEQAVSEYFADSPLNFNHIGPVDAQAVLAEQLCDLAPSSMNRILFANGGAEAVEAAMKLAWAATGRKKLLYCHQAFHGTSPATLAVMGNNRLRKPFEPLMDGCTAVEFNNLTQLEDGLRQRDVAAFLVEPVQAEGGVIEPETDYLIRARDLCRQYGSLFILDEIQTGLGRTGEWFACQKGSIENESIEADALVVGKALSGGISPIAAVLMNSDLHRQAYGKTTDFDLHSSTFGGNSLSCRVASRTLEIIREQQLVENSKQIGSQLITRLQQMLKSHPLVRSIRGSGLLIGIEFGFSDESIWRRLGQKGIDLVSRKVIGQWIAFRLLQKGIVAQPASHDWNILKLTPPLTLTGEQVDKLVNTLVEVLDENRSYTRVMRGVIKRMRMSRYDKRREMYGE